MSSIADHHDHSSSLHDIHDIHDIHEVHDTDENIRSHSLLACESCRRRKIKCDRELPRCSICSKACQTCTYRDGPLKPGPKRGASQRSRKRQRTDGNPIKTRTSEGCQDFRSSGDDISASTATAPARVSAVNGEKESTMDDDLPVPNRMPLVPDFGNVHHEYTPLSPETTISANTPKSGMSILSLSFIIHPSHETSDPQRAVEFEQSPDGLEENLSDEEPILVARACYALNISPDTLYRLIDLYFDRMTSFSLFRRPTFRAKMHSIASSKQLNALLAAMLSFSSRFDSEDENQNKRHSPASAPSIQTSEYFLDLALKFADEAMQECGDEGPSLCLLQALTLITFQQLIKGVHSKAWRSLGTCVRVAYEFYLHLVDSDYVDQISPLSESETSRWCLDEEKRRVWWAIWEMDTFASTIRRCPTSIDWSQNETNLPIDDEHWFRGEFQPSCFLTKSILDRWKALQGSGNQSAKAWFIVVNSFMREAQLLSSPRGAFRSSAERSKAWANNVFFSKTKRTCKQISQSLAVIENALHCFQLALPGHLKYHTEYLYFTPGNGGEESIHRDNAIYSIYIMMELTKFMTYHHGVFGGGRRKHVQTGASASGDVTPANAAQSSGTSTYFPVVPDSEALSRYAKAAEKILLIVNNSSEDHIRYVNPFLANTIWLAAAAQLVYKVFCPVGTNKMLVESNFEVLRLNYKQYVDYWKTSTSLQRNLDCLEKQLERFCAPLTNQTPWIDPANDDAHPNGEFGGHFANPQAGAEGEAYRSSSAWMPDAGDSCMHENGCVGAPQACDALFNGSLIQMGGGGVRNDPFEILEGLAFGLDFGLNADLSGYMTGLLSG